METTRHFWSVVRADLLALSVVALAAVPFRASAAEDITGEWEVTMEFGERETLATLTISKKADGGYTGTWGSTELSDVKFDGTKLTFVRTLRFGDQEFSMTYAGTLKEGSIKGTLSSDRGDFAANAVRRKPKSLALGRWDINFAVGDRDISAVLAISERPDGSLDAKWTSSAGEHVVSDVKFKDGKLSFARKSDFGDFQFESTYEGKVDGHKLTGTIKSDRGEIEANGKRIGAALIGKWELTTTTDRGTRTNALMVHGDLTGRYEFFGGELPIKEIKLDGDNVAFRVEAGFGDQTFAIDFRGKLDGASLKGEVETPRGTREVTGKKLEEKKAEPAADL